MLRLIGVFLLLISSVGTGRWMERREQQRIRQLEEMIRSMEYLKGEIRFARKTLPESFEQLSERVLSPFQELFLGLANELKYHPGTGFEEIFKDILDREKENFALLTNDMECFYQACCNLGHLDKEMQMHILDRYIKDLERTVEHLAKEMPQKTKLYRSLGILGGVFLVVILI